jgi:ornithine cyclodeaminase/alanine dehydrogenase-like protein (mu-crystallin family)
MNTAFERNIVFLSDDEIESMHIAPAEIRSAVESAFSNIERGLASAGLKSQIALPGSGYAQALPARADYLGVSGNKWVVIPDMAEGGGRIESSIVLTDLKTGKLKCVLEAGWITAARTAAMSAIAAQALAPRHCTSVGFIGAGRQAASHLVALKDAFPSIEEIRVSSVGDASHFMATAEKLELAVRLVDIPNDAVEEMDIVVSSVPAQGVGEPFLDANALKEGAFASMIDLGRSWARDSLAGIEYMATDDRAQSEALSNAGKLNYSGPFDWVLGELVLGARPVHKSGRRGFIFGGNGVADIAVADLIFQSATRQTHEHV